MKVSITPDQRAFSNFHSALRSLHRISGQDFETVLKHEVAAILTAAVRGTPKAKASKITADHMNQKAVVMDIKYQGPQSRSGRDYTPGQRASAQKRAAAARTSKGYALYLLRNRHPDWLYDKLVTARAKRIKDKLAARGLTASMWVRIADQLRLDIKAPSYVRNAKHHKRGQMADMVQAKAQGQGKKYEIAFANLLTELNKWNNVGAVFRRALNGRAKFFQKSVELASQKTIKRAIDRYPGLAKVS